jgi:transposase-like protein
MHVNQEPRRRHSEEFKSQVLAACAEPGASVSAVALSFGKRIPEPPLQGVARFGSGR